MSNFGGAGGAEYEFITQDHATSIQMKLAWRAYLERNISRSPDFIGLDMSSAHRIFEKRAPRVALAGKSAAAPLAAPRRAGTHRTHSTNVQLQSNCVRNHAGRTRSAVQGLDPRGSSPQNSVFIDNEYVCGKAGKPTLSEFRARSRRKALTPCTNEAFTSTARQDGFLERRERRERESHV